MKTSILFGVLLCVIGTLALVYGGFSFTHRERVLDLGPIHATAEKTESVLLPPLFGLLALAGGVALVVTGIRK